MRGLTRDPVGVAIFVVLAIVFWFAWNFVTNRMPPDDGAEFWAAKILFLVFLGLLAVGLGLRVGVRAVFNI